MKKILLIAFVFFSLKGFCQYPVNQNLGSDSTLVTSKGALKSRMVNTPFTDTTQANTQRIRQYPGAQIFTTSDNLLWVRNSTATGWISFGSGTGLPDTTWTGTGVSGSGKPIFVTHNIIDGRDSILVDTIGVLATKSDLVGLGGGTYTGSTGITLVGSDFRLVDNAPKLNISDSLAMLAPYLRVNVAAATYATISNLAVKVNISDTASMLSPYLRKIDSTLANRITANTNLINTNTNNIALKVNISDTSAMLSPYLRSNIAAATYQPIGSYATSTQLGAKLDTSGSYVNSGTIIWPGTIFSTPTTGVKTDHAISYSPALATQTANKIFSGPASGAAATPTWRILVSADLPSIALSSLSDVTITSPTNNNVLTYSTGTSKWINTAGVNYSFTSQRNNDLMKYDSVNDRWVNFQLTATAPLAYNSTTGVLSSSGGGTGWLLTGNSGVDTTVNFIGTTDDKDLFFKRNGVMSGRIDSTDGSSGSTSFGYKTLQNGNKSSTAFGFMALKVNNSGSQQQSAFGANALLANTSGVRNTAIGYNALKTIVSGSDLVAVGNNALSLATAGTSTAVGGSALLNTSTGVNTAMGFEAGKSVTTGTGNAFFGTSAGALNTGDGNAAFGAGSFGAAGAGSYNVALGWATTLSANTSGSFNMAIGRGSLASITTTSNTTAMGGNSGNLSTAANGAFFGMYAGAFLTTEANMLVINSLSRTNKAGDSTDSPIYGTQSTTKGSQMMRLNGQWGVNTTATSRLTVGGSFGAAYVAKSATYTADITDHDIECTSGTFTVTLPTAASIAGREYWITNTGSGTITIGTTSSQTFANVTGTPTTLTVAQFTSYRVVSNGSNWIAFKTVN